jgi:dTDP-glucose pyrophosphorylase
MENLNKYIVYQNENIRDAIKKMDEGGIGFVVCVGKNENVIGVISDGDFRRAVLSGISLDENVLKITNKDFKYLTKGYLKKDATDLFRDTVVQHIPVLENGKLVEIITEEAFYDIRGDEKSKNVLNIPVVIMAGGKGTRLDPFTRILPKPLIPLGDKTMIEIIMDEYAKHGMRKFYVSVNHKAKMIKAYFEDHDIGYKIEYIDESHALGTAGALKYLENKIDSPFFVSNCDIIIKDDYCKIYEFHKDRNFDLTLVASMQHHTVSYGVCEIENDGHLKEIKEKPKYDFLVNAGMYLLEPSVCKLISVDEYFDMTELISKCQKEGLTIGVYPVSEKSYIDVGRLSEYKKALKLLFDD